MLLTYIWRYTYFGFTDILEKKGMSADEAMGNSLTYIHLALLVNYLLLIFIAYRRGRRINKKYLAVFPFIGSFFDILIPLIPLVPTIMNIAVLIVGAAENKPQVIYVQTSPEKKQTA